MLRMAESNACVEYVSDCAIVSFPGEVDIQCRDGLREDLLWLLNQRIHGLIIDFSETSFCDSAGVHVVSRIYKRADALRVPVYLSVPAQGPVRRVFDIIGIDRWLPTYETREQAQRALLMHNREHQSAAPVPPQHA